MQTNSSNGKSRKRNSSDAATAVATTITATTAGLVSDMTMILKRCTIRRPCAVTHTRYCCN